VAAAEPAVIDSRGFARMNQVAGTIR